MAVFHNSDLDTHFLKVLSAVKKRPGMFLDPISLGSLRNFIIGYGSNYLFDDIENSNFFGLSSKFFDWIVKQEGEKTTPEKGWDKILMQNCSSDQEGVDKFFNYLDKFKELYSKM